MWLRIFYLMTFGCYTLIVSGQKTIIAFESNGKYDTLLAENPFQQFSGEWTLKEDQWTQNWGGETQTISIPQHHTVNSIINTANSLLSIIDGPEPNGHIFWSYNPVTKVVNHLSSFGTLRAGVGEGTISSRGDIALKIKFEGEPPHTYRIYNYTWNNSNEYHMKSVQYDSIGNPTGLFYEGTFVRLTNRERELKNEIQSILAVLDNNDISVAEQLGVYDEHVVHMAPNAAVHTGKKALGAYLREQRLYGKVEMKHEVVEVQDFGAAIIIRGAVNGTYYPANNGVPTTFRTKNLFVFGRANGVLKIKKVIYNMSPVP